MKAYGFMINGRGSHHGDDRKPNTLFRRTTTVKNALRACKKTARRAGKNAIKDAE